MYGGMYGKSQALSEVNSEMRVKSITYLVWTAENGGETGYLTAFRHVASNAAIFLCLLGIFHFPIPPACAKIP